MELVLDTKEDCFLCLQTILNSEKNELCLKNICRFLQINTCDVLLQGLKEEQRDASNLLQDTGVNFSVNLCRSCYAVAGKLSSLIQDLEVARLQVNYFSDVFEKILKKSDWVTTATRKTDYSVTADARVVEHLRKITKQKCSKRNEKRRLFAKWPTVKIKRVTQSTITSTGIKKVCGVAPIPATAELSDADNISLDICVASPSSISSTIEEIPLETLEFTNAPTSTSVLMQMSSQVTADQRENNAGKVQFLNTTHGNSFQKVFGLPSNVETGNIFPAINTDQILEDILTKYCGIQGSRKRYRCGFCEDFIKRKKWVVKRHVILKHPGKLLYFAKNWQVAEEVFEKLCGQAVQQEYDQCEISSTKADTNLVTPFSGSHYICYICKNVCSDGLYLREHLVKYHADILGEKLRNLQQEQTKMSNDSGIDQPGIPSESILKSCLEAGTVQFRTPQPTANSQCEHSELVGSAKKLKTNDSNRSAGDLLNCADDGKKKNNNTSDSSKISTDMIACLHCEKSVSRKGSRLHLMRWHPDQIFLSFKPEHTSLPEFANFCRKIFQKETIEYRNAKGLSRRCAYCILNYRNKINYLFHLVYYHEEILGGKIKALLENGDDKNKKAQLPGRERKDWIFGNSGERGEPAKLLNAHDNTFQTAFGLPSNNEMGNISEANLTRDSNMDPGQSSNGTSLLIRADVGKKNNEINNTRDTPKTCKDRTACLYCEKRFSRRDKVRLHMLRWHPDQIFLSFKPNDTSMPQFADSCRKIFQRETKGYAKGPMVSCQCAYCPATYRYKIDYLYHLVYSHEEILGEKIKVLLENEDDDENASYPVVEGEDWIFCDSEGPGDNMKDPLTGSEWDDLEGITVPPEHVNESDTKNFPLMDSFSFGECSSAAAEDNQYNSCETDFKDLSVTMDTLD